MKDELERYKRLLEEWNVGNPALPKKEMPPPPQPTEAPVHPPPRSQQGSEPPLPAGSQTRARLVPAGSLPVPGRHPGGAILTLDSEELVIYRRPVSGQEDYDLVYSLLADGSVKIEIIDLSKHKVEVLGQLPEPELQVLQEQMHWNRALLIPGCKNPEDAERNPRSRNPAWRPREFLASARAEPGTRPPRASALPFPAATSSPSGGVGFDDRLPQPGPVQLNSLKRGQKIHVKFGDKRWEAVYWGKDHKGYVVAHNTHKHWTLMHLDLERYKDTMLLEGVPNQQLIEAVTVDLRTKTEF